MLELVILGIVSLAILALAIFQIWPQGVSALHMAGMLRKKTGGDDAGGISAAES